MRKKKGCINSASNFSVAFIHYLCYETDSELWVLELTAAEKIPHLFTVNSWNEENIELVGRRICSCFCVILFKWSL